MFSLLFFLVFQFHKVVEFGFADKEAILSGNFMFTSLEIEKLNLKGH